MARFPGVKMQRAIMVMGVSGSGKSTIANALARHYGGALLDDDDYHPQSNVDHMAAGQPLTDAMRWPWLDRLAKEVNDARQDAATVFACSALRKTYRDHLRAAIPDLQVVYLDAPQDVVAKRLNMRRDHFMPAALLDSQYATLEPPQNAAAAVSVDQPVEEIIEALDRIL
ncbi:gluconokinase [Yoonia sp.]|uniref:gluconokinase n=1 Tax=Yoonia sp. TaxID=2212373 RepID=UPI0025EAD729|nr:gluconokinase [Yoonia sp.]